MPISSDILAICTGNICRSAYLEAVLRQRHPALNVRSAGTGALVGGAVPPPISDLLAERGITTAHVGTQLTREHVQGARLIVTATAEHRSAAISLDPTAADRTFTLLELARLLQPAVSIERGIDAILASARAGLQHDAGDHPDDLPDPYRRPTAAYVQMAQRIEAALRVIDPWLT